MLSPVAIERLKQHAVPIVVFGIVAVVAFIVTPVTIGEWSMMYDVTVVVFILSIWAGLPYALLVAVGTLPLLYTGIASFAAPQTMSEEPHVYTTEAAYRHFIAGVAYVLGATVVGAHGIIIQMSVRQEMMELPPSLQLSFLGVGGVLVAVAFVSLQFWRYDARLRTLSRWNILGTVGLGVLLALSPKVAYWVGWKFIL